MILAGLLLVGVGGADIVRRFVRAGWVGWVAAALLPVVLGVPAGAYVEMGVAGVLALLWVLSMPIDGSPRAGFWPAVILAAVCAAAVVLIPARAEAGLFDGILPVASPIGDIPVDLVVLALGAGLFLCESGNIVVRAALSGENSWQPRELAPRRMPAAAKGGTELTAPPADGFRGGRLIGPLERVIVLLLTLAAAYPILAAILAAKGIVRFPEISKDGETGARAEYFLVGSLVSWTCALGAAFLLWWAANS